MNEACFYRISVKGIVIDDYGRVLLTKEDNGKWEILGGGLEHNEDPIEGLKREIYEETGLKVTYVSPSPKYFITVKRLGYETYVANVIYEVKLESLDFKPSEECQELRFFSVEEMKQVELFPNTQKLMEILEQEQAK
jgi:8-oxo-dGTP pyrophosphatase MutT (NUDIX family)